MRKQLLMLCAALAAASCPGAFASSPLPEEPEGWSWQDGLLGSGSDRGDIFGDGNLYPGYLCAACGDPEEEPMDFVAVAYNGFFGENPWMLGSELGIPFRIYNLQMQWVVVWFEGIVFDSLTLLPDTLDVRVRLQNGQILTFTVLQDGPDLPIGDPNPEPPVDGGCGCGNDAEDGDGGDGDDYYTDSLEALPEPPGPSEGASIVDPDDNEGFPEWDL